MIRLACLIAVLASPAAACIHRDVWAAWLKEDNGMALQSWGLDDDGNMLELFTGPGGRFAVVRTDPGMCGEIAAIPFRTHGRLTVPEMGDRPLGSLPQNPRAMPGHPL